MRASGLLLSALLCVLGPSYLASETCEEKCALTCSISTQEVCDLCLSACKPPPRRVAPIGPSRQLGVDYHLHKTIGLTALSYKDDDFPGWYETAVDIGSLGFTTAQLWMDIPPYCPGHWHEPFPSHLWIQDIYGCEAEWLFKHGPLTQIFIKPSLTTWQILEDGCYIMDTAPQAFILNRLYEMAWNRDLTVVFTRWEQDWFPEGCSAQNDSQEERIEWLIQYESEMQRQFEQARKAMMQRYPNAKLNVLRSMVVNQFPGYNVDEGHLTISEAIGRMVRDPNLYEPDLVGVSYWKRGMDPIPALDWVHATTHYPKNRIFIAEFGARENEQPDRYYDYIPVFWDWGIRTILIWVYEDNWDHKYTPTDVGMASLQSLNQ